MLLLLILLHRVFSFQVYLMPHVMALLSSIGMTSLLFVSKLEVISSYVSTPF